MKKAIIFVAGQGSRLKRGHKCLVEVAGKTILEHQVQALLEADVEHVCFVTGWNGAELQEQILDVCGSELFPCFVRNGDWDKGSWLSLRCAAGFLHDEVYLMNGDTVVDPYCLDVLEKSEGCGALVSQGPPADPLTDFGAHITAPGGRPPVVTGLHRGMYDVAHEFLGVARVVEPVTTEMRLNLLLGKWPINAVWDDVLMSVAWSNPLVCHFGAGVSVDTEADLERAEQMFGGAG